MSPETEIGKYLVQKLAAASEEIGAQKSIIDAYQKHAERLSHLERDNKELRALTSTDAHKEVLRLRRVVERLNKDNAQLENTCATLRKKAADLETRLAQLTPMAKHLRRG
jgi:predicted nuclease with TOPRIM domain